MSNTERPVPTELDAFGLRLRLGTWWAVALLPPGIGLLLLGNHDGVGLIFALLLGLLVVRLPLTGVRKAIAASILILGSLSIMERVASAFAWSRPGANLSATVLSDNHNGLVGILRGDWASSHGTRSWLLPELSTPQARFTTQLRLEHGTPGRGWAKSEEDIRLNVRDGETTVVFPRDGDPFISRTAHLNSSAAGREFLATVEMRVTERPSSDRSTRGLWLREADGLRRWGYQTIPANSDWRVYEADWSVPEDTTSRAITMMLNDFDGATIQIRSARLFERLGTGTLTELPFLEPNGIQIQLEAIDRIGHRQEIRGPIVYPTRTPTTYDLPIPLASAHGPHIVRATLSVEPGLGIETRRTTISDSFAIPLPGDARQALTLGHPNLLGHTLAILWLSWLVIPRVRPTRKLAGITIGIAAFVGVWLTGSHAAILAAVGGSTIFAASANSRISVRAMYVVACALALLLLVYATGADPTNNTQSRVAIWQAAIESLLANPISGDPETRLAGFGLDATHAHNFWLQLAARYGLPGLAISVWVTCAVIAMSWKCARWRAVALIAPLFFLQTVDFTLFFSGVLYPAFTAAIVLTIHVGQGHLKPKSRPTPHGGRHEPN